MSPFHHTLARRKTLTLEDVIKEPLVVYNRKDYPEYHETLATLFATTKGKVDIAEEHDGVTSLAAAVESGHGIALVPSCLTAIVGARLKLIPLKPQAGLAIVGAAWKPESTTPFLEAFITASRNK